MKRFLALFILFAMTLTSLTLLVSCKDDDVTTTAANTTTATTTTTSSTTSTSVVDPSPSSIYINEVLGKSYGDTLAPDGGEYDWIELYNGADTAADISGWMLSNDPIAPNKYIFPAGTVVAPHGFLVVWAPGKDYIPPSNSYYAPFKVSSAGETIVLADPNMEIKQSITVPAVDGVDCDVSYARLTDGGDTWGKCYGTPNESNANSICQLPPSLVGISAENGFYNDEFDVTLTVEDGYTLKYTTDCSDPVTSSSALTWNGESVHVYDPSNDPVRYASINVQNANGTTQWAPEQIDKCFVLRVAAIDGKGNSTPVLTRCYFVGFDEKDGYSGMPIICLTSDPDGLYSKNGGLFVLNNGEYNWNANTHDTRDWERETNFAMFDANGEYLFDQNVGIKIRGTSTRGMAQKSLNIYARAAYGNREFAYPLFDTPARSLILRNDTLQNHHLGQGYLQDLAADRDILTQRSMTVLVFLEGEYHGVYTLYERFSENLVEDKYDIADDNIYTVKKFGGSWGAEFDAPTTEGLLACQKDINDILAYIADHDMSVKANYDYVCSRIDMDSLIDILCFQLYIGNVDFSLAQNISAWRTITPQPGNTYADCRWRFVVYDLDFSLVCSGGGKSYDAYSNPFTDMQPWAGNGFLGFQVSTCYFKLSGNTLVKDNSSRSLKYNFAEKMMASDEFCRQFVRTMEDMGNFNFNPERVKPLLDAQYALIAPVYAQFRKRVNQVANENPDPDVDEQLLGLLQDRYNMAMEYFSNRFDSIMEDLGEAFGLGNAQSNVTVSVSGVEQATLQINTSCNTVTSTGVTAVYYTDYELSFTAGSAPAGYVFDHWEITGASIAGGSASDASITVTMSDYVPVSAVAVYRAQ